jgi:hypothetical protein
VRPSGACRLAGRSEKFLRAGLHVPHRRCALGGAVEKTFQVTEPSTQDLREGVRRLLSERSRHRTDLPPWARPLHRKRDEIPQLLRAHVMGRVHGWTERRHVRPVWNVAPHRAARPRRPQGGGPAGRTQSPRPSQ